MTPTEACWKFVIGRNKTAFGDRNMISVNGVTKDYRDNFHGLPYEMITRCSEASVPSRPYDRVRQMSDRKTIHPAE